MAAPLEAYHLPPGIALAAARGDVRLADLGSDARADGVRIENDAGTPDPTAIGLALPNPTPAMLTALAERLRAAAASLRRIPLDERIAAIDRVAARWLAPDSAWRRAALAKVPLLTGYPAAVVGYGLDHLWQALRAPDLAAAVRVEMASAARGSPPPAARLAVHLLAGNVPGVGIFGLVAALLAGVPSLVKTARREPLVPALVARSLAAEDPRLAHALAVLHWPGGEPALDAAVLAAADVVLAYGRAETLDAVAAYRPRRLLRFGPRLSVGLIARDAVDATTAASAARAVALFDQQGCLSPQLLVVEEDDAAVTDRFTTRLAGTLAGLADELPRAPLSLAEATAVWRFVAEQHWRAQEGAPLRIEADAQGRFGVVCDRSGTPAASPLNRHVVVAPVPALGAAAEVLAPLKGLVEAVGFVGTVRRQREAAAVAAACGAHRLCPLDRMHAPPFAWRQGGYARLGTFVIDTTPAARTGPAVGRHGP